jgi:cell division septal protein FtsQ
MVFERNRKRIRSQRSTRIAFIRQVALGLAILSGIALIFFGIYHLTRIDAFTIQTVVVEGGSTISHDGIEQDVMTALRGSYWRLIPYTFSLLYPHDRIIESLHRYPRLHTPEVEREGLTQLHVHFEEYIPHALLCAGVSNTPCFFMDEHGFAFQEAPALHGGALVRFIEEDKERVVRGDTIAQNRLDSAQLFIDTVQQELGFRIGSVQYTESGDVLFMVNGGGMFKLDTTKNVQEALSNIRSVMATPEYTHIKPGNFQYIDVRFPPKIFVNETFEVAATTTETVATSSESGA